MDQPRSTVFRVVCELIVAAGNRTGRARRRHGKVPGDAHVHNFGVTEDRHESRRSSIGVGLVTRKSEENAV